MSTTIAQVMARATHGSGHPRTRDLAPWAESLRDSIDGVSTSTDAHAAMRRHGIHSVARHALRACLETAGHLYASTDDLSDSDAHAIAIDWLRVMMALEKHVASAAFRASCERQDAADADSRASESADPFAWADDAAAYYGGGSID